MFCAVYPPSSVDEFLDELHFGGGGAGAVEGWDLARLLASAAAHVHLFGSNQSTVSAACKPTTAG
jgi:hypothetical protein